MKRKKEKLTPTTMTLILECYKNDNILDRYMYAKRDLVLDNDCLDTLKNEEMLYITPIKKHNDLQTRIDKAIEYITSEKSIEVFKTIESREKWLKVNRNLLNILKGE